MNKKLIVVALAGLMAAPVVAEEQLFPGGDVQVETILAMQLAGLPAIELDDAQYVLSGALLNEDWSAFFTQRVPALVDYQDVIMHWSGIASINPKLLVALIEHQSQMLSTPEKADLQRPFGNLSDALVFSEQVRDIAGQLSRRFYAYQHLQAETDKVSLPVSSATLALASLLQKNSAKPFNKDNAKLSADHAQPLRDFLATYKRLFDGPRESVLLTDSEAKAESGDQQIQAFSMNLPWSSGYAWYSGGAHSNTGSGYPYSSLDFNNGSGGWGSNTPWVQAAHAGTVSRYSSCNIRITHASGYATNYYHMSSLQYQSGDYVAAGAYIGRYASNYNQALCQGGQSSGPHVHFSLLYNGQYVSLHNRYISGYRVDVGNYNYDTNCYNFYFERNGQKTCAWYPLYR
ncbi:M23 family metallopeptidase [Bowmanella denitrificans]|uniref:M23 family metallopeptidase n=1 Tax=Bowmanella denitrificans TaxID=366582 RepID=A0ABN0WLW5_9ALTE